MKKTWIIFLALVIFFIGFWGWKMLSPVQPVITPLPESTQATPWWETVTNGEAPTPDPAWVLDPEIPANYIPIINSNELYMVLDDNGNIEAYRQRTRQEDGSWLWKTVNPDIPENYVAVDGLEDVYKVTEQDGSVKYMKYHRNEDNSYYFTEVDETGAPIVSIVPPDGAEVPQNAIRESGNVFAVYDENGVRQGYIERFENAGGEYTWEEVEAPAIITPNAPDINVTIVNPVIPDSQPSQSDPTAPSGSESIIVSGTIGYKETETITSVENTDDGWTVVYETIITYIYDEDGVLISTQKDGPHEINRFPTTEVNSQNSN